MGFIFGDMYLYALCRTCYCQPSSLHRRENASPRLTWNINPKTHRGSFYLVRLLSSKMVTSILTGLSQGKKNIQCNYSQLKYELYFLTQGNITYNDPAAIVHHFPFISRGWNIFLDTFVETLSCLQASCGCFPWQ